MARQNFNLLPEKLRNLLSGLPRIAIAFSGGIDSRFLAHAALLCGCKVLAINGAGPHISPDETIWAREWARNRSLPLIPIYFDPLDIEEVRANSPRRCYSCKKALLENIRHAVLAYGSNWTLCDGGNADDLNQYRPGIQAVREANVISPLAEANIDKSEIRRLAAITGLDFCDQPSRPCLLTRLNYGLEPKREMLARIVACETEIAKKFGKTQEFRLRLLPEPVLQVTSDLPAGVPEILSKYGFENAGIYYTKEISGFFDSMKN